jgi:hypothetical protein
MHRQQLEKTYYKITSRLNDKESFLGKYSPQKYVALLKNYSSLVSYDWVSEEVDSFCKKIVYSFGQTYLEEFHKIILLQLILENLEEICNKDLPNGVKSLYLLNFERIAKEIETDSYLGPFLYLNDKFCKDIALCSLRMIPVGARKIHLSALSKSFLFKNGVQQFLEGLSYVLFDVKGFSPLYIMHTDSKDPNLVRELNEEGWINSYRLIANLLKSNEKIKGVFATSWFYDPQLKYISPKFYLCTKIATNHGGKIFYIGSDDQTIKDSLLKSETRRKLYEEGKYLPTRYLLIWSRKKLINWSGKN